MLTIQDCPHPGMTLLKSLQAITCATMISYTQLTKNTVMVTFKDLMPGNFDKFVVQLNALTRKYAHYIFSVTLEFKVEQPSKEQLKNAVKTKNHRNVDYASIGTQHCCQCYQINSIHHDIWMNSNWSLNKKYAVREMDMFLLSGQSKRLPIDIRKRIYSFIF